jgi:O-antigen ligase
VDVSPASAHRIATIFERQAWFQSPIPACRIQTGFEDLLGPLRNKTGKKSERREIGALRREFEMNVFVLRSMAIMAIAAVLAIVTGYYITQTEYTAVLSLVGCALILFFAFRTSYIALLGFGLLDPFSVPLPFIWGFPPVLLILGICLFRQVLRGSIAQKKEVHPTNAVIPAFCIFFGWIFIRFCMNPTLPHLSGFGEDISGFRPFLNYGICFMVVFTLGRFIHSRSDVLKFARALTWTAGCLSILFIGLMFTRNVTIAGILQWLGLFISVYDNGLFRFIVLPGFGIVLITLAFLPRMFPAKRFTRVLILCLGLAAVVLGGSRSGLGMTIAILVATPLLKKNIPVFAATLGSIIILTITGYFVGATVSKQDQSGIFRVLALVSPDIAESTQATGTWEYRQLRWQRALEEIRNHPLTGRGYGGVENAYLFRDGYSWEEARIEIDLASGGIHNGYLACALALGIPAALLFIGLFSWGIWRNARLAWTSKDPTIAQIHTFICVSLIAYALSIYIGTDLNNPMIWTLLGLGILTERITRREIQRTTTTEQFSEQPHPLGSTRLRLIAQGQSR